MLDATYCITNPNSKGFKVGIVDKYFEKFIRNHMHGLRPHAVKQLYAKMQ